MIGYARKIQMRSEFITAVEDIAEVSYWERWELGPYYFVNTFEKNSSLSEISYIVC